MSLLDQALSMVDSDAIGEALQVLGDLPEKYRKDVESMLDSFGEALSKGQVLRGLEELRGAWDAKSSVD